MDRRVRYANPAALRMLGAPADYLGLALDSVFVDDASQKKIDQEIARRRNGLIGNYRVTARRISDGREIPIEITITRDQKISESTPKTFGSLSGTGCDPWNASLSA